MQNLQNIEKKLQLLILNNLPFELILTDVNFQIRFLNEKARQTLGYDLKDLLGSNFQEILSMENPVGLVEKILNNLANEQWMGDLIFTCKSHVDKVLKIYAQKITERENFLGFSFLALPKGDFKVLEPQTSNMDIQQVVQDLTHKLNNPMVGIFNFAQLLLDRLSPSDPNYELAQTVFQAAKDCKQIIDQWRKKYLTNHEEKS